MCSGSLKAEGQLDVRGVLHGDKPIKKLFSKEQRQFYAEHAPDGLDLNDLSILGPINVFKLKWKPVDFPRKVVAELWNYPDGSRIIELSTKCLPADAFQAAAEGTRFSARRASRRAAPNPRRPAPRSSSSPKELKSQGQ